VWRAPVSNEELEEIAQLSNVLENTNEYLTAEIREQCERILPDVHEVCLKALSHYCV
jgi:hypothetical protein